MQMNRRMRRDRIKHMRAVAVAHRRHFGEKRGWANSYKPTVIEARTAYLATLGYDVDGSKLEVASGD